MTEQHRYNHEAVGSKDTNGFRLSPNDSVTHIEQSLGITFPGQPAKIRFDARNIATCVRRDPRMALTDAIPMRVRMIGKAHGNGVYRPDFNAIFTKKRSDITD